MAGGLTTNIFKKAFLRSLSNLEGGYLEVVCPQETYRFGSPASSHHALIAIHDDKFFRDALLGGDVGVGEAYMRGAWSTPDLVSVVRLGIRNLSRLEDASLLSGFVNRSIDFLRHLMRRNSQKGSRRNIAYHYDLGNDFYKLFLDDSLAYSCAYYESPFDTLEDAQRRKFEVICRKLDLQENDRLLEIGTGWGGFAAYAAKTRGCRITTTTISREQYEFAKNLLVKEGLEGKIDLLFEDYRNLRGCFDKIVSIEMFEAVGYKHYDEYFGACNRLLNSNGNMLLQTITIQESKFDQYRKRSDWIKKYIFPGAELASVVEIQKSLKRSTQMQLFHLEDIGTHYALTLREWRRRFLGSLDQVRALGFDEGFVRMWDYYLAYCDGAFLERYIGDVQVVLCKGESRRFSEPALLNGKWSGAVESY